MNRETHHPIRKHGSQCYRITLAGELFGQIRKHSDGWHAEVRHANNGELVRYAGIWKTLSDAIEELTT